MGTTILSDPQKQFHAVSLSGGKDSTAMLLLMIERGMPIDMVLSADTGMEFPEMYAHLAKLDDHLYRERGLHITTLRHPQGFEYLMFDEPKQKPQSLESRARLGIPPYGNGWPGIRVRWCTGQLKTHLISKEVNRLKGELGALHYVGIAADEAWRCKDEQYPLVDWGITEAQALQACYPWQDHRLCGIAADILQLHSHGQTLAQDTVYVAYAFGRQGLLFPASPQQCVIKRLDDVWIQLR